MLHPTAMDLNHVARWADGHLDGIAHEKRVLRVASTLFDLTRSHHQLSHQARFLLRAGALVHDVGRCIDKDDHPVRGARMILRDRSLRIAESQRRALAFLTLYHRDAIPDPGDEAILNKHDDREELRKLLALLRAADALDSRSLESPRLVFGLKKRRVKVWAYFEDLSARTRRVYLRRKKFRMLEEELGLDVIVDLRSGELAQMVA